MYELISSIVLILARIDLIPTITCYSIKGHLAQGYTSKKPINTTCHNVYLILVSLAALGFLKKKGKNWVKIRHIPNTYEVIEMIYKSMKEVYNSRVLDSS